MGFDLGALAVMVTWIVLVCASEIGSRPGSKIIGSTSASSGRCIVLAAEDLASRLDILVIEGMKMEVNKGSNGETGYAFELDIIEDDVRVVKTVLDLPTSSSGEDLVAVLLEILEMGKWSDENAFHEAVVE